MRAWMPVLLVLAVAGCGGGEKDESPTPAASSTPAAGTEAAGTVDPLAITSFACHRDAGGQWKVRGTLKNSGKQVRDYRITAFIGQQTGPARTVDLDRVKAGGSAPFALDPVVAAPDGPCRLQAVIVHG